MKIYVVKIGKRYFEEWESIATILETPILQKAKKWNDLSRARNVAEAVGGKVVEVRYKNEN